MLFNGKQGVKKEMKSSLKNKSTAKEGNAFGTLLVSCWDIYNVSKFLEKNTGYFWLEFNH